MKRSPRHRGWNMLLQTVAGTSCPRIFLPLSGVWLLTSGFSTAIFDSNSNGLSDFWEREHNAGELFAANFDPQADYDEDGWTNVEEAAAGTDPHDPNPPDGLIRPVTAHIPAVMGEENGVPFVETPEAITVTWPTLTGKQYTLFYSPDLTQGSWLPVEDAFIASGSVVTYNFPISEADKCFWRVAVRDVDTDGDGLTDHEEHQFGTNPNLPITFPGIPDLWLVANFPSTEGFDPNGDPDGDGINNDLENQLGLDPNHFDKIGPVNFGFDEEIIDSPDMSFREAMFPYPSDLYDQSSIPGWNDDDEENIEGWQANTGSHIEIWDESIALSSLQQQTEGGAQASPPAPSSPYVELQSHLGGHGLKQEFNMLPGSRLNFILRYKGRYDDYVYDNAFDLKVEGASEMLVDGTPAGLDGNTRSKSFMDDDEWDAYTDWHYAAVSITAETGSSGLKKITLKLVPKTTTRTGENGEEEITYGGFVDLVPVDIDDDAFATGVDDVSITANSQDIGSQDKFWIMAPSGNDPNGNPCSNAMKFKIPASSSLELEISYPQGGQAPATATPATVTLANAGTDCAWHGESATTTETPAVEWKIGAPGQAKTAVGLPIAVKTMKRRTVKVALHQIVSVVPGKPNNPPDHMPTNLQVEEKLNQIFWRQINAWFQVTPLPVEEVPFDIADEDTYLPKEFQLGVKPVPGDGYLAFHLWNQPEVSIATANRPADYDIHVYVLGGASPIQTLVASQYNPDHLTPGERQLGRANTEPGANYCIIDGDRTSNVIADRHRTPADVLHTIAHEVGHIIVGQGHPDDEEGFAPLSGTDRTTRLMCSGPRWNANSLLLVKQEWDKAEEWLNNYIQDP